MNAMEFRNANNANKVGNDGQYLQICRINNKKPFKPRSMHIYCFFRLKHSYAIGALSAK